MVVARSLQKAVLFNATSGEDHGKMLGIRAPFDDDHEGVTELRISDA